MFYYDPCYFSIVRVPTHVTPVDKMWSAVGFLHDLDDISRRNSIKMCVQD